MQACRVALLSNRSLFTTVVKSLLEGVGSYQLCVVSVADPDWDDQLRKLEPKAVVFDSGDVSLQDTVMKLLNDCCPNTKVISLNPSRDGIDVYLKQRVTQTDLSTLLEVIEARPV